MLGGFCMADVTRRSGLSPALRFIAFLVTGVWGVLGAGELSGPLHHPPRAIAAPAAVVVRSRAAESGWPAALPPSSERLAAALKAFSTRLGSPGALTAPLPAHVGQTAGQTAARIDDQTKTADWSVDQSADPIAARGPRTSAPSDLADSSSGSSPAGPGQRPPKPPYRFEPASTPRARAAVTAAFAALGKPYRWGAVGPDAYDCSGLVQQAWRAAGVKIPRTSSQQARSGDGVSLSAIKPGDLVIYYGGQSHVGIYVGDGMVIHSPHTGTTVQLAWVLAMPINRIVRYG
jgi:cell wall-associated NlpC family hydrolase